MNRRSIARIGFAMWVGAGIVACASPQEEKPTELQAKAGTANPADHFCLEHGHSLKALVTNGVPTGSLCVSEQGKKCPSWQFYRGECALD